MIVGCQGVVTFDFQEFEITVRTEGAFEPRGISIPDAGLFNVVSFRIDGEEIVHDRNEIDGRSFVELFPQLRLPPVFPGRKIVLTVGNRTTIPRLFSCSIAGVVQKSGRESRSCVPVGAATPSRRDRSSFSTSTPYCKECLQRWLSEYKMPGKTSQPRTPDGGNAVSRDDEACSREGTLDAEPGSVTLGGKGSAAEPGRLPAGPPLGECCCGHPMHEGQPCPWQGDLRPPDFVERRTCPCDGHDPDDDGPGIFVHAEPGLHGTSPAAPVARHCGDGYLGCAEGACSCPCGECISAATCAAAGAPGNDVGKCPKCAAPMVDVTDYVDGKPAQRVFFDCPNCEFQMAEVVPSPAAPAPDEVERAEHLERMIAQHDGGDHRGHSYEYGEHWGPPKAGTAVCEFCTLLAKYRARDAAAERRLLHWEDVDDEWSAEIAEAHPTRSGSHDAYGIAMRMVGHRHSKGQLVSLVNWLLVRLAARRPRVRDEMAEADRGVEWEEASERGGSVFRPRSFHLDCGGAFLETRTSSSSRGPWTCEKCGEVTNTIDPQHGAATFAKSTP